MPVYNVLLGKTTEVNEIQIVRVKAPNFKAIEDCCWDMVELPDNWDATQTTYDSIEVHGEINLADDNETDVDVDLTKED